MKKSELIEAIAEKAGLTKVEAGKALDATFEVIANQLEKGEKVPVAGFGTFKLSSRAAREGRNLITIRVFNGFLILAEAYLCCRIGN